MTRLRYVWVRTLALGLILGLAACGTPGGSADPLTSDEALRGMDALANDVEFELSRLENDADLAAVAGFFGSTVTVAQAGVLAPAGILAPAQLDGGTELPRGVVQWTAESGYAPVDGAAPPAPYDYQVLGNPADATAELRVDWDAGAPTEEVTIGDATVELPVDAAAVVLVGGDPVADATFVADWATVAETRCGATEPSLTATALEFDVTIGSHVLAIDAATTGSGTTLTVEVGVGVLGADLTLTLDEQVRILATPCPGELPLGGAIGTPSSATLDAGVRSPDHDATLGVDVTGATWESTGGFASLTVFDLAGSLAIDGSEAVGIDGTFDAEATPPFRAFVRFDDRTMTVEEIVEELFGTAP